MRIHHLHFIFRLAMWLTPFSAVHAQVPASPTSEQLIQIMRSQPTVDVSAPVTATASFDPPLVRPGEKSIYRVTLNATEVSVNLPGEIPAPAALKLSRSVSGQNTQPIGGGQQIVSTFNYDVRALEPGTFTVPTFTVEVYGQPVVVPAAPLAVRRDLPEPHSPVRQLLMEPTATNIFLGEAFNVSVRLPATPASPVEGVVQLQLNGDGFIVDKNAVRQSISAVEKNGVKVPTYIYETSVTPIAVGPLRLVAQGFSAGMQFSGPVVISGQVSLAGGVPKYVLLESEPVTINVRPLPTESELPGFTGLIGSYLSDPPSLVTNRLKVGEPVQLTVVIRGEKYLNRITAPRPPRVPGWQIFPAARGAIIAGTGTNLPGASFKYTLIPLTDQLRATPTIPFSCFDPAHGQYVNLAIPSMPVTVTPDVTLTNDAAALMLGDRSAELEKKTGLSKLAPLPGRTGSLMPWQRRAWFPCVQLLPVLGFCGLWLWDRRRRFLKQHPEIIRRRQARRALRRELRRLESSAAAGDAAGFIRGAINALQIASAPHYPAAPRALVCGDVLPILTASERAGKSGEIVRRFFAAADAAAFANPTGTQMELFTEKNALREILAKLEARL